MEKKRNSTLIYDGKIIKVTKDIVYLDNGLCTTREIVHHRGGVSILAKDPEGKFLFVKQYRYALQKDFLELPAGKLEKEDETKESAAKRELEEETGYKANSLTFLGTIYPTPGYSTEPLYLFYTDQLQKSQTHFDEDERIELIKLTLEEYQKAILNGTIQDAKTIAALEYYQLMNKIN